MYGTIGIIKKIHFKYATQTCLKQHGINASLYFTMMGFLLTSTGETEPSLKIEMLLYLVQLFRSRF